MGSGIFFNNGRNVVSFFSRYILISQAKDSSEPVIPSALEKHLINDRFPQLQDRWIGHLDLLPEKPHGLPITAPVQSSIPILE